MAVDSAIQQTLDGGYLPVPTDQVRLSAPDSVTPFRHAQQPLGADRLIGALDADKLSITEHRSALDQPCGGCAEHHPARRCGGFHPLGHTDLFTDGGVSERA